MNKEEILTLTRDWIRNEFSGEPTGHDYFHIKRVVKNALIIAKQENADLFLVELSAWLHDVGDHKLHNGTDCAAELISEFLKTLGVDAPLIPKVIEIVSQVSFSKGKQPTTIEAGIVQDADRLDAIGAIGIARVFAYGGKKGREIWNPENPELTSIQHFYDKLLKLDKLMNTDAGRKMASTRHSFLEEFLERFFLEWEATIE